MTRLEHQLLIVRGARRSREQLGFALQIAEKPGVRIPQEPLLSRSGLRDSSFKQSLPMLQDSMSRSRLQGGLNRAGRVPSAATTGDNARYQGSRLPGPGPPCHGPLLGPQADHLISSACARPDVSSGGHNSGIWFGKATTRSRSR